MLNTETKRRIVELRSEGKSIASIAKEAGVAKQTVVDVCKEMKEEVAALYAVRLDSLYEEQKIGTEERIRNLSGLLAKIKKEIEGRTLEDVPTEKLVDMYIKTASALEATLIKPIFKSTGEQAEEKAEREILRSLC